jgi:hypothetical protein
MKRMRRKFKAMQRDINGRSVDWRTLYMESKQAEEAGLKDKKKKKKSRDKNAEKREKDRKKREKEKELIKKKLQASKTHKDKIKQVRAPMHDSVFRDRRGTFIFTELYLGDLGRLPLPFPPSCATFIHHHCPTSRHVFLHSQSLILAATCHLTLPT